MGAKDKLTKPESDKGRMASSNGDLKEELTQYDNLALPLILFFNSASTASSSGESFKADHQEWAKESDSPHPPESR